MVWDKLHKLRDKSADEWLTRGRQELAKWQERLLGKGCAEMSEAQLRKALSDSSTLDETLSALLKRMRETPRLTPAFTQRDEVTRLMRERFPAEAQRLIAQADEVCAGRFTIFEQTFAFDTIPDWHCEPRSGKRTPLAHWSQLDYLNPDVAGDKKFTWELSRHQFLITLGQAYWLTGDEKYAARFVELVNDWIAANPPKQGINWASSLELAFRVIAWVWALHYFAFSTSVTNEFLKRMLKSLIQQTQHVETYLSRYFSPNTHLTGEALALLTVGTALPELKQAEHWRAMGQRILLEQLPRHVGRDGVYFEQASYYHRYTADFYTHLRLLSNDELPPLVNEKLAGLFEHLLWITRPDGASTFYGDDDGGKLVWLSGRKTDDWRDTLATGAALFNRSDWKSVAGDASELLWLLGAESWQAYDALKAEAPTADFKAFVESGYYVMRDGWDGDAGYVLLDSGKHGAMNCGHAHADALSFEFAADGVTWLVDPGTFTYTGDLALRDEIRSSFSHNTVSVDGETQSVPDKAFTWRHTAQSLVRECQNNDAELAVTGQQNGYVRLSDPVRQRRSFNFLKNNFAVPNTASDRLVIRDEIEARATHRYAVHFHFAPDCEVTIENGNQARVTHSGSKTLHMRWQKGAGEFLTGANWQVAQGWVSRCYGKRAAAQVLTISFEAKGNVALGNTLEQSGYPMSTSTSTVEYHLEELAVAKSQTDLRKSLPTLPSQFASILDIGCGAGQTLLACDLQRGVLACGIDIDEEAVAFGHARLDGHLKLACAVGEALPFANASFEVVISRVAVPYMHIPTALTEIARVLTPGGHLWLTLHPYQMVFEFLARAVKAGNVKSMIYFSYALLNGVAFHCFGKLWRFPLNRQRCESFQTAAAMQRALRRAGFAQVEMEQAPNRFAIKAIKA